jgi:hypothetical protein
MIKKKVWRYFCEFCKRKSAATPKPIQGHERTCWWNPARRACKTCAHYEREEDWIPGRYGDVHEISEWCAAFEQNVDRDHGWGIVHDCPRWTARASTAEADVNKG